MSPRRRVVAVFLTALVLRLGFLAFWNGTPFAPDTVTYLSVADNVAAGRGFMTSGTEPESNRAPLYPLLLAGVRRAFGESPTPVLAVQCLLDALTAVWVLLLAAELAGPRAGLAAGLLYAAQPIFIGYTHWLLSESFFFDLWFLSLALTARAWKARSASGFAGAGAALGLAVLCRPAHMFYPALIVLALALSPFPRKRAAACAAAFCAGFVLLLSPWTARNWLRFHKLIPVVTGGGNAWYAGSLPDSQFPSAEDVKAAVGGGIDPFSPEGDAILGRLAKRNWKEHGPALLARMPVRLVRFWVTSHCSVFSMDRTNADYRARGQWGALAVKSVLLGLQVLILAGGFWGAWALRRRWREGLLLLLLPAAYASLHIFNDYKPNRYHLTALPCLWTLFFWAWHERRAVSRR